MQRMGFCIGLKAEVIDEYKRIHREVWPGVLAAISRANIRNYTIFLREPENLLFGYWEYHGSDFAADMSKMAEQEVTRRWWALCGPCQAPLASRAPGEWWAMMEQVFHHD